MLHDAGIGLSWVLAERVWLNAGVRFAAYAQRRRKAHAGAPRRILADFLIGTHAIDVGALITYDDFFRSNFPELRVIDR
jgi:predicted nucleic acid-binding protein